MASGDDKPQEACPACATGARVLGVVGLEGVSDRVDEELREKDARTFHTPEGWVISEVGRYVSAPGDRGKGLAEEWTSEEATTPTVQERIESLVEELKA